MNIVAIQRIAHYKALIALIRMGTREQIRPLEIATAVLPSPLAPYETYLGSLIRRGEKHQVTFTKTDALRPLFASNETLWAAFGVLGERC